MRFFNTAGPCDPAYHYMLPAAERLPEVPGLVERGMYFVVHAPRQTGKTTSLRALARALTAQGKLAALHFTCELKVWRDKKPDPLDEGLGQLDEYRDRLGLDHGVLVIFDRRGRHPGSDESAPVIAFEQAQTQHGRAVTVLRA